MLKKYRGSEYALTRISCSQVAPRVADAGNPTMTLLLGVFVYGEPFTLAHTVCFSLIWAGLIMISIEILLRRP